MRNYSLAPFPRKNDEEEGDRGVRSVVIYEDKHKSSELIS